MHLPRLMTVTEAAETLSLSAANLNKMRMRGDGPLYVKIGARVAYDPADLAAWIEQQKRRSVRDAGGAAE